jgi:hypothetical protein
MSDAKQSKGNRRPLATQTKIGPKNKMGSGPEITISQAPLGRSTLVDVQDDMRASPFPRAPLLTVSYDDLPLDTRREKKSQPTSSVQPTAASLAEPPPPMRRPQTSAPEIELHDEPQTGTRTRFSAPEISFREASMGRDTFAVIHGEAGEEEAPRPSAAIMCDALELRTFVVPEEYLSLRSTDQDKRDFVKGRLAHKIPCDVADVRRIDVKTFEPGAILLRVWCPVD